MPAAGKILVVFVGMLAATRLKIPLSIALLAGGVGLGRIQAKMSRATSREGALWVSHPREIRSTPVSATSRCW